MSSVDVVVPQLGETVTTAFIAQWFKQPGEYVAQGESVLEVDSDKASLEIPAPVGGVLGEYLVSEGDEVAIGSAVVRISPGDAPAVSAGAPEPVTPETPASSSKTGPAARQLATAKGIDLSGVTGSGLGGRILSQDVDAAAKAGRVPASEAPPAAETPPTAETPALETGERPTRRVRMSPLRRTIARRLVEAQQTAAILTTFNEVDLSRVKTLRAEYQDRFVKRYGHKLGFMSFFIKAAVEALKEFPAVNSEIDGDEILYKYFYDIGVAVSSPKGLMVPVVRDCDRLSLAEIEAAIGALANRARQNKLTLADFQGGTFTISNGGVFGSMMSTPILNIPQVAILGMHAIQDRAVVISGQIVVRPMMYLALSYDHRIIDGREAVTFLKRIKELVEAPERILLEV
jgi:2-oxoglutarate dehydrogenase E2 component (dihydrolipoamide succinyltransferase)